MEHGRGVQVHCCEVLVGRYVVAGRRLLDRLSRQGPLRTRREVVAPWLAARLLPQCRPVRGREVILLQPLVHRGGADVRHSFGCREFVDVSLVKSKKQRLLAT